MPETLVKYLGFRHNWSSIGSSVKGFCGCENSILSGITDGFSVSHVRLIVLSLMGRVINSGRWFSVCFCSVILNISIGGVRRSLQGCRFPS